MTQRRTARARARARTATATTTRTKPQRRRARGQRARKKGASSATVWPRRPPLSGEDGEALEIARSGHAHLSRAPYFHLILINLTLCARNPIGAFRRHCTCRNANSLPPLGLLPSPPASSGPGQAISVFAPAGPCSHAIGCAHTRLVEASVSVPVRLF